MIAQKPSIRVPRSPMKTHQPKIAGSVAQKEMVLGRTLLRKSWRECACAEGVTVGQALPCLEQLGELVSKGFNLQQCLLPIALQVGYDDLDVQLLWESAREITKRGLEVPVPKVGEKVADLPRAKHARNAIQIHVKVPIVSINDRSICIQLNEWRPAVFASVSVPLHGEIPLSAAIVSRNEVAC